VMRFVVYYVFFFFFFQAEDGIRDFHVTGVQTCALPIYTLMYDLEGNAHYPFDEWIGFKKYQRRSPFVEVKVAEMAAESTYRETRSEERRVGKECRSRWSPDH